MLLLATENLRIFFTWNMGAYTPGRVGRPAVLRGGRERAGLVSGYWLECLLNHQAPSDVGTIPSHPLESQFLLCVKSNESFLPTSLHIT